MSATLSADYCLTDGAVGARFLASIVKNLENPLRMLLQLAGGSIRATRPALEKHGPAVPTMHHSPKS